MSRDDAIHHRLQALVFHGKAAAFQLRRGVENFLNRDLRRHPFSARLTDAPVVAESVTPLWTESEPEERPLLAGKVHNLRLAVKRLHGLEVPADAVFSFWKCLGRAGRLNGYVTGRELREGCVIPNTGGGLCQLSNALHDAALKAGLTIVERHAHTRVVPGSLAEQGRDATVFWNYVDLRFKAPAPFRVEATLSKDALRVRFRSFGADAFSIHQDFSVSPRLQNAGDAPQSCATCGVERCFRSLKNPNKASRFGRVAFLVDAFTPEFDAYLRRVHENRDFLFLPLDGRRFRKPNYAWTTAGFAKVKQRVFLTLRRAIQSRKLAAQGAARQLNLLAMSEKLADRYARALPWDATHVVVQQNLLPFLWRSGALGGRTFDVLMNALPMEELHRRLDHAASLHPECRTLADFRAEETLVRDEAKALRHAERILTPHTAVAALFGERAELLGWISPPVQPPAKRSPGGKLTVVFPTSTAGRKGCYELREALRGLDVKLLVPGAELEGPDFWRGIDMQKGGADWPERADLVVLPAFVEHNPRRLLLAAARGIPVLATPACGVEGVPGILTIQPGDAAGLREAIR